APHAIPQTLPETLLLAAEIAEKVQHLALVNKEQKTDIDSLKNLFQVGMLPVQFCKQLNGVNINQANLCLQERHFLYDAEKDIYKPHVWRVHAYTRDKYLTKSPYITATETVQRQCYRIVLLKKRSFMAISSISKKQATDEERLERSIHPRQILSSYIRNNDE
ncbi:MAG: hypothetical protein ACL7BU_06700, partial [Candidatus Phlomobacter fragariae]